MELKVYLTMKVTEKQREADNDNYQKRKKLKYTFGGAHICTKIPEAAEKDVFVHVC